MKSRIYMVIVLQVCAVCCAAQGIDANEQGMRFYLGVEYEEAGVVRRFGRYPIEAGNVWTYHNTYKKRIGPSTAITTITWTSEITVREHVKTPEGTMVLRECKVRDIECDSPPDASEKDLNWLKAELTKPTCEHYLIFQSGYALEVRPEYWNEQKRALTEEGLKALNHRDDSNGEVVPDLPDLIRGELPKLPEGDESSYWRWCVEGEETVETPLGAMEGTVHLLWMANGGGRHKYFKDGIGFVKEWYKHAGTYFEDEHVLVSFKRKEL